MKCKHEITKAPRPRMGDYRKRCRCCGWTTQGNFNYCKPCIDRAFRGDR